MYADDINSLDENINATENTEIVRHPVACRNQIGKD
jgi:hypothetical protein